MRVQSFLSDVVGEYQDKGRDNVPEGYAWAMKDFVPGLHSGALRGRGGWDDISGLMAADPYALAYGRFQNTDRLVALAGNNAYEIPVAGTGVTLIGSVGGQTNRQNPVYYRGYFYIPFSGAAWRTLIYAFGAWSIGTLASFHQQGSYATVYRDRLVAGRTSTDETLVGFSKPGDPSLAWDSLSYIQTAAGVTGLQAMRNQILVFHRDFVEQIRGTVPPDSALSDPTGDMSLTLLWDKAGCVDARSIAMWQGNVIFADGSGVHITDGGLVRNLVAQGGMQTPWRKQFEGWIDAAADSVASAVFGDYLVCTVRIFVGQLKTTWVCHIPTRRWFRWTNIDSAAHVSSAGPVERIYGLNVATRRVVLLNDCFNPSSTSAIQADGNGTNVLPEVETPWKLIGNRVGLRRLYDAFLRFLGYQTVDPGTNLVELSLTTTPEDTTYEVVGGSRQAAEMDRRKLLVARQVEGVAFKIRALAGMNDFRVHSLGVSVEAEEEHRV